MAMMSCMCHTPKLIEITMSGHVTRSMFREAFVLLRTARDETKWTAGSCFRPCLYIGLGYVERCLVIETGSFIMIYLLWSLPALCFVTYISNAFGKRGNGSSDMPKHIRKAFDLLIYSAYNTL